ncbi:60S acidic ribosomal protein P2-like [Gigantopelta aegis]|uniref:60S acidic ribosomal protein P2-like n=1 Tax=Gigantopelta aegis TaxID=1735272 RepID=UPI001B889471|nr:60S acidic ribosomal protein P2-like [Gigantopelta aegis]
MRYVAAYLLAAMGGKVPTAAMIEKILGSVGIEAEADKIKKIIAELNGKNLEDLIAEGQKKLQSVPSGGAVAVSAAAASGGGGAPAPAAEGKKEEKKKPEPESESEDEDMGFGLFD